MKKEEITQNNKLIAEFMEFPTKLTCKNVNATMKYHSSWDWLMPVVEKVQNAASPTNDETSEEEFVLLDNVGDSLIVVRIDLVHQAVVEFINWYNKNK